MTVLIIDKIRLVVTSTILFSLLLVNIASAQIDYYELIDTSVLHDAKFRLLEKVNTDSLEFSPVFYDGGLVYVSSWTNPKKKIKSKRKGNFYKLKMLIFDDNGNVDTIEDFADDLKIKNHKGPCAFTQDGNKMFLSRNKKGTIKIKDKEKDINPMGIYIYKYQNGYWLSEGELPVNSYGYKVFHPSWDEKTNRLFFASDMPGGYGGTDLYSIKYIDGKWLELKNLGRGINSEANEAFPFIYKSKYLFFASNRKGGKGGFDLYLSIQIDDEFDFPVNLGPRFNSRSDDFGLILSDDAYFGFFTSNRPGGIGKDDIYKFISDKSIFRIFNNYYTLKIVNSKNGKPVENARITFSKYKLVPTESPRIEKIKGVEKEIIYTIDPRSLVESKPVFSDNKGEYFLRLKDRSYILKVKKDGYLPYSGLLKTIDGNKLIEVKLIPEILDTFQFSFLDSDSKERIENVNIKLEGGLENNIKYKKDKYYVVLLRGQKISLEVNKDDYIPKKIEIEYGLTPSKFDILLEQKPKYVKYLPVEKGEVMVLKDILYDYNSAKLSAKAKRELDKLVNHLNKYPELIIELSSHTDCRGKKSYNLKLSERRSANAKKYLVNKGISANRIIAKGYGETKPKNRCVDGVKCSEKEHAINRRTEVKVVEK